MDKNPGVIVGRFQVPFLHKGHLSLFKEVIDHHELVIVAVCRDASFYRNKNNPLTYRMVVDNINQCLFNEQFRSSPIPMIYGNIKDCRTDEEWSRNLDEFISIVINDKSYEFGKNPLLYGSRDSFIEKYSGKYRTKKVFPVLSSCSGTQSRNFCVDTLSDTENDIYKEYGHLLRTGFIANEMTRYPRINVTADIAVIDKKNNILLGKKLNEDKLRFPGGFFDIENDKSVEETAIRELREETGVILSIDDLYFLGTHRVNDWRYANTEDICLTSFYVSHINNFYSAIPNDDLDSLEKVNISSFDPVNLVPEHLPLWKSLINYHKKLKNLS